MVLERKKLVVIDASSVSSGGGLFYLFSFVEWVKRWNFNMSSELNIRLSLFLDQRVRHNEDIEKILKYDFIDQVSYRPQSSFQLLYHLTCVKNYVYKNKAEIDLVMTWNGINLLNYKDTICINQNVLPYCPLQVIRYGFSIELIRLAAIYILTLISIAQSKSYYFLSEWALNKARDCIRLPILTRKLKRTSIAMDHMSSIDNCDRPLNRSREALSITYVSRIDYYKNQLYVIQEVDKLRALLDIEVNLNLVGGAYEPYVNKYVSDFNQSWVKMTSGHVQRCEVDRFLRESDVLVFASSCESFAITVFEYVNSGRPYILPDEAFYKEILGLDYPSFTIGRKGSLVRAILTVIKHPYSFGKHRSEIEYLKTRYSSDAIYPEILRCILK